MKSRILNLALIAAFAGALVACENEGPAERAGKQIDESIEKAGEKIEQAGDKLREETQR